MLHTRGRRGEHEEGEVKGENVAPAPLCFGVHAAHNIQRWNDFV